jgi:hypothetical protein
MLKVIEYIYFGTKLLEASPYYNEAALKGKHRFFFYKPVRIMGKHRKIVGEIKTGK